MGFFPFDYGQKSGQFPNMAGWRKKLEDEIVGRGLDMKALSVQAGLGETYVRDALKRGRGKLENLRKIAVALGRPANWLDDEGDGAPVTLFRPEPNATLPVYQQFPRGRIPIFGHAAGGADGRFVMNGERVGETFCPPSLEGVEGAYAVYVHGDSMAPRFKAGETVWVNPHLPVRRGDDVVVQLLRSSVDDGTPPDAFVKEFVSRGGTTLILYQHNPPEGQDRELRFPEDQVLSVHRIVFAGLS
ncbi:S24 family peptidase [Chelatococcus reniformis]|uniref:Repressor n=1 Tax=Chelatococcus reniformis TaxID=1494448 RepID=A0A916UEK6_9HYPH|nr:helix-turn-helix transcriptional regulator [Chelatococcus reniformis]GGC70512.1 repressor [Chelatococcus reniformis]